RRAPGGEPQGLELLGDQLVQGEGGESFESGPDQDVAEVAVQGVSGEVGANAARGPLEGGASFEGASLAHGGEELDVGPQTRAVGEVLPQGTTARGRPGRPR